jgi:hypothetical protein
MRCALPAFLFSLILAALSPRAARAELLAGAAKVDITNLEAGPVDGPLHARALVLKRGSTSLAIVTLDVVSLGEIGYIKNDFLPKLRERIEKELRIPPTNTLVNTSHCHGIPCTDVEERTFQAVKQAAANLVAVRIGTGSGHEDRISENRRMKLKSGKEADVRHAYSLPPDDEVVSTGPIDPQIGVLRLDRQDGRTLAVVYNFACHPIQGMPSGANTADLTGFASEVIEDNLSEGAVALFLQGCGGDINPAMYKEPNLPRSAETLGNLLGLSALKAVRKIEPKEEARLTVLNVKLELPRSDLAPRITALEAEQQRLVQSLAGTSLNLKTFLPLVVKYNLDREFPSYYSHRYLHEQQLGREELAKHDADTRQKIKAYMQNIFTMEQLTRNNTNLALLKKHQADNLAATKRAIDVELMGVRIGDFVLVTFPGELTVQIGLGVKERSPHQPTFVAGYTNGYIYYCPTAEQLANAGYAQEDSDCILAPEWQAIFEAKVTEILRKL